MLTQTLATRSAPSLTSAEDEHDNADASDDDVTSGSSLPVAGQSERVQLSFATYSSDGYPHLLAYVQCHM